MTGTDASEIHDSQLDQSVDFSAMMASLRLAGADQFDPVRVHYLQILAQRAIGHQPPVKHLLDARLTHALAVFKERFEQAQGDAQEAIAHIVRHHPQAAGDLQRLFAIGDFKAVRRLIATLASHASGASLGSLARYIAQHSPDKVEADLDASTGLRSELKTTQYFRETWSRLSVGKRLAHELDQAPKNAGPINSHMLVLRSLAKMRDISPDYLNRFTSYMDTLLSLDQCDKEKQASTKKTADSDSGKKTKSRRAKAQ